MYSSTGVRSFRWTLCGGESSEPMNGPHASTNVRFVSISMHAHNANKTTRTQRDEHNVYLARDTPRMRPLGIDTKVDRTAKDLARDTVAEPVAEGLTASGG